MQQDFYAPPTGEVSTDPVVLFDPARSGAADSTQAVIDQSKPYVPPDLPQAPAQTPRPATAAVSPLAPATSSSPRRSAGVGILLAGLGAGAGAYFGGAYGAGAGLLLVGASRNILRATRSWSTQHSEAVKSGTMALFGLGVGGWLAYKAWEGRRDG